MIINQNSGGNVGIAMTGPSVALDVTGSIEYTGTITDVSDERLKEHIVPLASNLEKLRQLNPVSFNMIGATSTQLGFLAQNVQPLFPDTVSVVDPVLGYLGLDYTQLIAPAIGAIQELDLNLETIASTTASSTPESKLFAESFFGNIFARITEWLASATNGITDFFANRVHTAEICLSEEGGGETCITKAELDALLAGVGSATGSGQSGSGAGGVSSGTSPDSGSPQTDTAAPTITINGNNPATISAGDTYNDLGASVTDDVDQNLGYQVSVDGGAASAPDTLYIDTGAAGTHTIEYSATDQAGNIGTAERTVIVEVATPVEPPPSDAPPADDRGDTSSTPSTGSTSSPQAGTTTQETL